MQVSFLKPAQQELDDAYHYYESVQPGLGYRFQNEVRKSIARVLEFPLSYQEIGRYSRRCLVHKFPYGVIYQYDHEAQQILVVAIAHLHRKPDYWFGRDTT